MHKRVKILAILLAAQLLLAAGIGLSNWDNAATREPVALVGFDPEKIDRIILEGPESARVTLVKRDLDWMLPESGEFPADRDKVEQLLQRLQTLRSGTPIATSIAARQRFKVSEEQFERSIALSEGEHTVARLFLGSSPGLRLIHARNASSDAIHVVKMAAHNVPVKTSDWEDKSALVFSKSTIVAIEVNGLRIERSAPGLDRDQATGDSSQLPAWQADGLADGRQLKPAAADTLAGLIADLRFVSVLGRDARDEYGLEKPALELSLVRDGGETLTYRVSEASDREDYTLKVSNRPEYFRLASYKAKPLIEAASLDTLTETSAQSVTDDTVASEKNAES